MSATCRRRASCATCSIGWPPSRAMPAVETRRLSKRYGSSAEALRDLDLEVHEGETFGLLGPNGAGKTSTVKILITLARPDAGSAEVGGIDVMRDPARVRRMFGYVPQELTADRYLSARENLRWF